MVSEMVDACTEAASDTGCDVETTVEQLFRAYRLPRTAAAGARGRGGTGVRSGSSPSTCRPAAGSDANALIAAGLPTLNLANGTERNHQPDESVTVEALETMLDVALALIDQLRGAGGLMGFERIDSEEVWQGHIGGVRVDTFRYDDGSEAKREIVSHPGAVTVAALRRRAHLAGAPAARAGGRAVAARAARRQDRRAGRGASRPPPGASWRRRSARAPTTGATS